MSDDRRRPQAPAPPGTGGGLLSFVLLACLLPLATSMAIGEWSPRGVDAWLDRIGWTFLLSLMIVVPPFVGWPGRRYWAICWFWIGGLILLSVYLPCLAIAAAVPLGWAGLACRTRWCWRTMPWRSSSMLTGVLGAPLLADPAILPALD